MNSKYLKFIAFIVALVIIGMFFSSELVPIKDFFSQIASPIARPLVSFSNSIRGFFGDLGSIRSLSKQNTALEKENDQLKAQVAELSDIKHENEVLKKQLGFVETQKDKELVPAKVIGYSPTGFFQTLKIDKGSKDGVQKGKAVISEGFLIGTIKELGNDYSEVSLITNNRSLVPVVLNQSRGTGLLRGGLKGLVIEDIPLDNKIINGESVVTSGLGGDLPSGIIVGEVKEIISSESEIFQRASIKTPVEFGRLEMVFVIK